MKPAVDWWENDSTQNQEHHRKTQTDMSVFNQIEIPNGELKEPHVEPQVSDTCTKLNKPSKTQKSTTKE